MESNLQFGDGGPDRPEVARDEWLRLPSGRLVSVRGMSQTGDVRVRYLNDDGGMESGEFILSPDFLAKAQKVNPNE